jgi:hypothetical protein
MAEGLNCKRHPPDSLEEFYFNSKDV